MVACLARSCPIIGTRCGLDRGRWVSRAGRAGCARRACYHATMPKRPRSTARDFAMLALILIGLVAFGVLALPRFRGSDFVHAWRWWRPAGWAAVVVGVHLLVERRSVCPACGMRPAAIE